MNRVSNYNDQSLEQTNPLGAFIKGDYSILPAIDTNGIRQTFGVRHAVFCKEKGFEPLKTDQLETDPFDNHSTQLLLTLKGHAIGCTRFVHGYVNEETHLVPLETYARRQLDRNMMNKIHSSGKNYAEISRLAILPEFRGNKSNIHKPLGLFAANAALIQLILGMQAYAVLSGTDHMIAAVEPKLKRCLNAFGVPTHSLGEPVEHKGKRLPILIVTEECKIPKMYLPFYLRTKFRIKKSLFEAHTKTPTSSMMSFSPDEFSHAEFTL